MCTVNIAASMAVDKIAGSIMQNMNHNFKSSCTSGMDAGTSGTLKGG